MLLVQWMELAMGPLKGFRGSRDHPTMELFSSGIRQRWRCAFSFLYESGPPSLVSGCAPTRCSLSIFLAWRLAGSNENSRESSLSGLAE